MTDKPELVPTLTGYEECRCILSQYCDGQCRPIYVMKPQPAAHLTIPGALEWDGDNGTHGADGESRGHGESKPVAQPVAQPVAWLNTSTGNVTTSAVVVMDWDDEREHVQSLYVHADGGDVDRLTALCVDKDERMSAMNKSWADCIEQRDTLRAHLANTEQSRRSFFDLSQDLEKRLAERDDPCSWSDAQILEFLGVSLRNVDVLGAVHLKEIRQGFEYMRDLNRKAVAASAEPAKPKTCIECDQPYCHGVCVERGDQDYDRYQAAKGGDDE
jgi:hypothetical protein